MAVSVKISLVKLYSPSFFLTLIALALTSISVRATGQTITQITVPANTLWTDTGIALRDGQTISISASGSWNWGQAQQSFGPDGDPNTPFPYYGNQFADFDIESLGRLTGFVGTDPFQGEWGNNTFFPQTSGYISVGSGKTFSSPFGGELWLGFNDDAVLEGVGDNTGQVVALITVGNKDITGPIISIAVPSTTYLLNQKVPAKYSCTDPDDVVASCAGPVASGQDFDTSVEGIRAFTVLASDSHGNASAKTQVYLVGNVGPTPGLVNFLPQSVGSKSPVQRVTLTNPQAVAQDITGISVTGNFTETTDCTSALAPHSRCSVNVTSVPTQAGVSGGFLTFNFPSGSESAGLVGFASPVVLVPGALSFGSQKVGTTSPPKKVTLSNGLTTGLTISSINVSGQFAIMPSGTCPRSGILAAGMSCTAEVTFKPKTSGAQKGTLNFQTSYPTAPVELTLNGTGTP